jgi:hypothetical protein
MPTPKFRAPSENAPFQENPGPNQVPNQGSNPAPNQVPGQVPNQPNQFPNLVPSQGFVQTPNPVPNQAPNQVPTQFPNQAPVLDPPRDPKFKAFNWNGQRVDENTNPSLIYPQSNDLSPDPPNPYPYGFTFDLGYVVNMYGQSEPLNPLQYASADTAARIKRAIRKVLPDTVLEEDENIAYLVEGPFSTTRYQRGLKILNRADPLNYGAIAAQIMFNGWDQFLVWCQQTFNSQGVRVDTTVTDGVLY